MPPSSLLASLLKKAASFSSSSSCSWKLVKLHSNLDRIRPFSSLTSASRKKWSYFSEDDCETETSSVYSHALKFQRPSTIKYGENSVNNRPLTLQWPSPSQYKKQPFNSISLIGTIESPLKRINMLDRYGVHTLLRVQTSPQSKTSFRVLLKMWDEMAEMSMNHLKPNDFVYVWGNLGSYVKADENGNPKVKYEVIAKEINYVAQNGEKPINQQVKKLNSQASGEDYLERQRDRLHLWQVFFANPYEWRDLRKSKTNPKHPDFKNMTTGEALWLKNSDPPWVKRQLQFLDSVLAEQSLGGGHKSYTSCSSLLASDTTENWRT